MAILALDWDLTCVDRDQEWFAGSLNFIRAAKAAGHKVFIHSSRANSPDGVATIKQGLAKVGLDLEVKAKPQADLYVDDLAAFPNWDALYRHPALSK